MFDDLLSQMEDALSEVKKVKGPDKNLLRDLGIKE